MLDKCPGAANLRTPEIKLKKCPKCKAEVEIFTSDIQVKCGKCGFTIYNDIQSCAKWCKFAEKCLGEEQYKKLIEKK